MLLSELTDQALFDLHQEKLAKLKAARADEDLDLCARYLPIIRATTAEMQRRMQAQK